MKLTVKHNKKEEYVKLPMKSLLVLYSYHHMNTEKIAKVFAKVLDAQIKTPQQIDFKELETTFASSSPDV